MGDFKVGQKVGSWDSTFGNSDITIKKEIGKGYKTKLEAENEIVRNGTQGVITKENDGKFHAYTIDDGSYLDDLNLGEKITSKAKSVVEFIGDDNCSLIEGKEIYPPAPDKDNGKVIHVFSSFSGIDKVIAKAPNLYLMSDDIKRLQELGYTVKIDYNATKEELKEALYDNRTAGIIWIGHGGGGGVVDYNKNWIEHYDIEKDKVSKNLKMVVFEACQVGQKEKEWKETLNNAEVIAWSRKVPNGEMMWFNTFSIRESAHALDTLIEKNLGGDFAKIKYK